MGAASHDGSEAPHDAGFAEQDGVPLFSAPAMAAHPSVPLALEPPGTPAADPYPERAPLTPTELLLILGFWTVIAVLTTANTLLEPREVRAPWQPVVPFAQMLVAFANAYMWAALTPLIFRLTARFKFERSGWGTRLMIVLLGLVLAIGVDLATNYVRSQLFYKPSPLTPELQALIRLRRLWFMNEFIVFVAVLAAGFARNYFLRYRVRQLETMNLKAQAAQLQAQLADARLAALRTQLNPHFLFNTLHAVSALVERDPRGVRRMIARLSELLRTTLDEAEEPEVPLQRELTFIERYLDVMQIRFQGNLQVQWRIDPEVADALVPNLILQPLVENAVKHGVGKIVGVGQLELCARRAGSQVLLTVRDNGPGTSGVAARGSEGVGLRNIRQRLQQLYGADQSLTLRPADNGGLLAEITLPYHTRSALRAAVATAEA